RRAAGGGVPQEPAAPQPARARVRAAPARRAARGAAGRPRPGVLRARGGPVGGRAAL
ncbi:unnamed protein product, partial [Heterosigma akashiwo]